MVMTFSISALRHYRIAAVLWLAAASWPGREGEGRGWKQGQQGKNWDFEVFYNLRFLFSLKKKKIIIIISTSLPSPLLEAASRNIPVGKRKSILFPLKPAANRWMCRTWIQTGVTSLCSGCRSRTTLPRGLPSLPASVQPGWHPPTFPFSPGWMMENQAGDLPCNAVL